MAGGSCALVAAGILCGDAEALESIPDTVREMHAALPIRGYGDGVDAGKIDSAD